MSMRIDALIPSRGEKNSLPMVAAHLRYPDYLCIMKHLLLFLSLSALPVFGQTDRSVYLRPKQIPGFMGLQSFAFGQHDGKWVIIGGRLDGLHRRQPFAAFDSIGHNNQIFVIDPKTNELWKAPVDGLAPALRDQLKGTNICFTQDSTRLLLAGGYGISGTGENHITFPYLTIVELPELIAAVQNGTPGDHLFRQYADERFAVTGGQLLKAGSIYHLVGGHRFDGQYNPADRPTFTQTYTNANREFILNGSGEPEILGETQDIQLHRRDFNMTLNQDKSGDQYLMAYSGVFQEKKDLPFLSAVRVLQMKMQEQPSFRQYYNHYHCPDFSYYDVKNDEMNTLFFGGISQYYDSLGILVQDNQVPFVATISRVIQHAGNVTVEYKLPVEMPALLGAGGEFIPNPEAGLYRKGIFQFPEDAPDSLFIGTIVGGIASTARNIFWINDDAESAASSGMYEVYLVKSMQRNQKNEMSCSPVSLYAYWNENEPWYRVHFTLPKTTMVELKWTNRKGRVIHKATFMEHGGERVYDAKYLPKKPGPCKISLTVEGVTSEIIFMVPEKEDRM